MPNTCFKKYIYSYIYYTFTFNYIFNPDFQISQKRKCGSEKILISLENFTYSLTPRKYNTSKFKKLQYQYHHILTHFNFTNFVKMLKVIFFSFFFLKRERVF
jgi:hypothetical protein